MDQLVQNKSDKKKRNHGNTIECYFKRLKTDCSCDSETNINENRRDLNLIVEEQQQSSIDIDNNKSNSESILSIDASGAGSSTSKSSTTGIQAAIYDIGNFVSNMNTIDDFTRYQLITNHWIPSKTYTFPYSLHNKRGREEKRRPSHNHFEKYKWLVFSEKQGGLFCKYCSVFTQEQLVGRHKHLIKKVLISEPLNKYAKLTGKEGVLNTHENANYHIQAMEKAHNFVLAYEHPEVDVRNQISEHRKQQVEENRSRLLPILKTIILHGQRNIPLRGHRDDGSLLNDSEDINIVESNDGCFRALLRFRIDAGDSQLKKHLENTASNATYISKTTANQLIICCGEEIVSTIVEKISISQYYAIIFDETSDVAKISQLSISVRYVHKSKVYEDFVGFLDLHSTNYDSDLREEPVITGKILGQSVILKIKSLDLDLKNCVGIGCDGCAVNMSKVKGAAVEIKKEAINAAICPCFNHALNLTLSKSSTVKSIKNSMGIIQEIVAFFQGSPKRHFVLKKHIKHTLNRPCETRWIERHDSILQFQTDLPLIVAALEEISEWDDNASSSKANILLKGVCECEFILSINCLADIFSLTLPFSKFLQTKNIDLEETVSKLKPLLEVIENKRSNADNEFNLIIKNASKVMKDLNIEMRLPRLASRQCHRQGSYDQKNIEPETYWKRVIYIPLLDSILQDFKNRFADENVVALTLNILIPKNLNNYTDNTLDEKINEIHNKFQYLIDEPSLTKLKGEIILYKKTVMQNSILVDTALDSLGNCDKIYFPHVHKLLLILATLPVSIATAERSFSTLRTLKTWLRANMGQDRLTGLALLYIHKNLEINLENVINRFAKSKRKLDFVM